MKIPEEVRVHLGTGKILKMRSHLRDVYASETKVLKMDRCVRGESLETQTRIEIERYRTAPKSVKKYLPKVFKTRLTSTGAALLVQERIHFKSVRRPESRWNEYESIVREIENKTGWCLYDTGHNWGVRADNNKIVIFDFAI